jgi:hypothetical protein
MLDTYLDIPEEGHILDTYLDIPEEGSDVRQTPT